MSDSWGAGDKNKWSNHGTVRVGGKEYPLIYGEHPHSRSDNNHYVVMDEREPVGFNGHRILIDLKFTSKNYLKDSYYSGDEIRKSGSAKIYADREQVYEFFYRDVQWALRKSDQLISELMEHSSGWMLKQERQKLIGRKIYYREVPSLITRLIVEQGCLMINTADGKPFSPPIYDKDAIDDLENDVKTSVLDPNIWWHRD